MRTIKTTINIDEELWKRFSIIIIQKYGGRKKNEVVEQLIRKYVDQNESEGGK